VNAVDGSDALTEQPDSSENSTPWANYCNRAAIRKQSEQVSGASCRLR
jgi:hypothetical protein